MTGASVPPSPWRDLDGSKLLQLARFDGIDVANVVATTAVVESAAISGLDAVLNADLTDTSERTVYDLSTGAVPQARLGGPASELSAYPLAGGDLAADYATAGDLSDHVAATNVHGVDTVAGQADVDSVGSDLIDHASNTNNPHNVTTDQIGAADTASAPVTLDGTGTIGLSTGNGLTLSGGTLVAALAEGLTIDANGNIRVAAGGVTEAMLAFSTATQGELDTVASDLSTHESATSAHGSNGSVAGLNDVDAAESAAESYADTQVSNHADRSDNPHNVTDDQTGASTALSNHVSDNNPHGLTFQVGSVRDVTGSRTLNTSYSHNRGNPIYVSAIVEGADTLIRVNGSYIADNESLASGERGSVFGVVSTGGTYEIDSIGSLVSIKEQDIEVA